MESFAVKLHLRCLRGPDYASAASLLSEMHHITGFEVTSKGWYKKVETRVTWQSFEKENYLKEHYREY